MTIADIVKKHADAWQVSMIRKGATITGLQRKVFESGFLQGYAESALQSANKQKDDVVKLQKELADYLAKR